jgi:ABC-2 type transport system ATP-binding protein
MAVGEVIGFARAFYETWDENFCREMTDLFELDLRKKIKQLSKGMLVKLGLLLALSHRPELLILDEPTTGLDPIVHESVLDGVLRSMCEGRCTVLFSSHNLGDIRRLADSVCVLREGRILVQRGLDDLLACTKRVRAVLIDGHLPRWSPERTLWQQVRRREWLLTIDGFNAGIAEQIKAENPVESIEVFDLSLGDLFRDYILGEGPQR